MNLDVSDWLRIELRRGILCVHHARSAKTESEAHAVLAAIEAGLDRFGVELLMIDSRDADRTPPEMAAIVWAWLNDRPTLRKVATLMVSRELSRSVRVHGADHGVRLRTFTDAEAARSWLHAR